MGLADELSYVYPRPSALNRSMQAVAATRPGAWAFSKTVARIDRALADRTGGRTTLPALLAGLPVLELTTTGRRSGLPRRTHLIAVPTGDTLALLGTNFGQPRTPAWVLNLEAQPAATVTHRGISRAVLARAADESERASILAESARYYGGYLRYQERITGRRLRLFVLEPAPVG